MLFLIFKFSYKNFGVYQYSLILVLFLMLFVSVFLVFKSQTAGTDSSAPLLLKVLEAFLRPQQTAAAKAPGHSRSGRRPLMHPRAGRGEHSLSPSRCLQSTSVWAGPLAAAPQPWAACRAGWASAPKGILSTRWSPIPSLHPIPARPRAPRTHPPHKPGALHAQGHMPVPLALSKARCPLCRLPGPCPGSSTGILTHTQHHVSQQRTELQPRGLGGRQPGAGKGGTSRTSGPGSRREELPTPAARGPPSSMAGLRRPALVPPSHDQIPKNKWLGLGPEEGEERGGLSRAGQADGGVDKVAAVGSTG